MRLWHKDLIAVLPREQLIAQWRELSAIAGAIQKNGTPNHILVNFVLDYDFNHFISYAAVVRREMTWRGYRSSEAVWKKITSLKENCYNYIPFENIYANKMDDTYLTICYYNLLEKFLCGSFKYEQFEAIYDKCNIVPKLK